MHQRTLRSRRIGAVFVIVAAVIGMIFLSSDTWQHQAAQPASAAPSGKAAGLLTTIPIKGRAPKTGYARTQFGDGWATTAGCDTRNIILHRDLQQATIGDGCKVRSGTLDDPYTGKLISFKRGADSSGDVQIDHVVALGDAWQTGAQQLAKDVRVKLANDPLELLAVDGPANQQKSDSDAASWLPPNKLFRCQYVARQVAVKAKYHLWVTQAEHDAISRVLSACPGQPLPSA